MTNTLTGARAAASVSITSAPPPTALTPDRGSTGLSPAPATTQIGDA